MKHFAKYGSMHPTSQATGGYSVCTLIEYGDIKIFETMEFLCHGQNGKLSCKPFSSKIHFWSFSLSFHRKSSIRSRGSAQTSTMIAIQLSLKRSSLGELEFSREKQLLKCKLLLSRNTHTFPCCLNVKLSQPFQIRSFFGKLFPFVFKRHESFSFIAKHFEAGY